MKKENENLVKEVMEANRALMNEFQNDRMLILFDVLNEEQYRDYLEQRSSIRKDIQTKRSDSICIYRSTIAVSAKKAVYL